MYDILSQFSESFLESIRTVILFNNILAVYIDSVSKFYHLLKLKCHLQMKQ